VANEFIKPGELDTLLRYPAGRSARLARKKLIPHVLLPDGEIRFDPQAIERWLLGRTGAPMILACSERPRA